MVFKPKYAPECHVFSTTDFLRPRSRFHRKANLVCNIKELVIVYLIHVLISMQICHEVERFSTYLTEIKVAVFYGGVNIKTHKELLKNECPHIVVGTPGRILALARDKDLVLKNVRHFILDECDKMLESLGIRFVLCFSV